MCFKPHSKKLFSKYGQFIIAVCENVKTHLVRDYQYDEKRIKIIANPIDSENFQFTNRTRNSSDPIKVAIVGRATGPKAERTNQVIRALLSGKLDQVKFKISLVGADRTQLNIPPGMKEKIEEIKRERE